MAPSPWSSGVGWAPRGGLPPLGKWLPKRPRFEERMGVNPDFNDLFSELCAADARFIVVGAHAVIFHTTPRYTKDIDVWVEPTPENARRVHAALVRFGAPMASTVARDWRRGCRRRPTTTMRRLPKGLAQLPSSRRDGRGPSRRLAAFETVAEDRGGHVGPELVAEGCERRLLRNGGPRVGKSENR